jgi:hypothetical protein
VSGDDRTHVGQRLRCLEHCALHRRTITLTCPACGRARRLDAVALWWLFRRKRWDDRLPAAYRRFRCAACAGTGRIVRPRGAITRDPPDDDQPPYPDRPTWRRLVSRYRS